MPIAITMAKILVIDDEDNIRTVMVTTLRRAGYSVVEASNASEGFSIACRESFDLIISDICMEGCDGISLLKQIRSTTNTATVPFIFVTGHADLETVTIGAEEQADSLLPKPFTVSTLLATVERRVNRETLVRKRADSIRHQLHEILEASPDFIGIIDPRTNQFVFVNSAGRKMIGRDAGEDVSGITLESIQVESAANLAQRMERTMSDGAWTGETFFLQPSGENVPVKLRLQAHRTDEMCDAYVAVMAHDLTEAKRLEEERKTIELQLIQAHKLESIGQLAAGIAHEINTPTQYICDNTRFLQDSFRAVTAALGTFREFLRQAKTAPLQARQIAELERTLAEADLDFILAEIPQAIEQSLSGLERVTKIVRAMKDFSHPGVVEKTPIDVNHAIESTVTVAKNEWKYVADVELKLDRSLPLVPCVPGELNQLVLNLVVNAAHAIEEVVTKKPDTKGTITITTRHTGSGVEIQIKDTGAGIPEHIQKKIFEPFFTTKQVGKGTGQGLAIARSVVSKHKGTISFDTELGQGTMFSVKLPAC